MDVTVENKTRRKLAATIFADDDGNLRILLFDLPFDAAKVATIKVDEQCTTTVSLDDFKGVAV